MEEAMRRLECLGGAATLALTILSGCASIVSDNESTVYVATEPETARCELHGQDFTRALNTPDSIVLPSDAAPVTVACETEGYRTTTGELDTSADGWMAGNIIFGLLGGGIGLVVDAARGAGMKYPPNITIVLEPESFASLEARDAWYDNRRRILSEKWEAAIEEAGKNCKLASDVCEDRLKKARETRDQELEGLEQRRATAQIAG
jgi:hypothetical protein